MRKINNALKPPDELKNAYEIFIEIMENPRRSAYLLLLKKIKPESREIVNLKLLDRKKDIDWKIRKLTEEILKLIGFE